MFLCYLTKEWYTLQCIPEPTTMNESWKQSITKSLINTFHSTCIDRRDTLHRIQNNKSIDRTYMIEYVKQLYSKNKFFILNIDSPLYEHRLETIINISIRIMREWFIDIK